ncbi:MAG: ribonuclease H-like domain-containing protein [Desulfomonilaceae bacterium]
MLKNTFCHIPGIGETSERNLWSSGVLCWDDVLRAASTGLSRKGHALLKRQIAESFARLKDNNPRYFVNSLPSNGCWRLLPDFLHSTAYLDIETTGLGGPRDYITTIALYDGKRIYTYVRGRNLDDFRADIAKYKVMVTYNGKCFDIPFIENDLGIKMNHAHIDLRYVLKSLGYSGGLKGCEKKLGLSREELEGIDGFFAVLLWKDFKANNNEKALETLLAYNVTDTVNLETLMFTAYNMKLKETPFLPTHQLTVPERPLNPFTPDMKTIYRIRGW